jgi:tRNA G37 N-methylase Trm5
MVGFSALTLVNDIAFWEEKQRKQKEKQQRAFDKVMSFHGLSAVDETKTKEEKKMRKPRSESVHGKGRSLSHSESSASASAVVEMVELARQEKV